MKRLAVALLLLVSATRTFAQDRAVIPPDRRGAAPSAAALRASVAALREAAPADPAPFEFRNAWRQKVSRVRAERARVSAAVSPWLVSLMQPTAVRDTLRVPVLLGTYPGVSAPYPTADYQNKLFASTTSITIRSLYLQMSRGAFSINGTVGSWATLPNPRSYYEPQGSSDQFGRTGDFIRHVLSASDASVNFGLFDNDGPDGIPNSGDDDGIADVVAFLQPAAGKECGGPGIWAHRWVIEGWGGGAFETNDLRPNGTPIRVSDYILQSGVACDGVNIMPIGVMAHELGHALGLPDLYDTQPANGTSEGLGYWDLMASGNWINPNSPAHMSAWSKEFLGWVQVHPLSASSTGTVLPPVYDNGIVWRYNVPGTTEYYLMEHRARVGSDAFLPREGMLVYHVDAAVAENATRLRENTVNGDEAHKGVDLVEADGRDDLDAGRNRGDAGDVFPGSSNVGVLSYNTIPHDKDYAGRPSNLELRSIAMTGGSLTMNVVVHPAGSRYFASSPALEMTGGPAVAHLDSIRVSTLDGSAVGIKAISAPAFVTVVTDTGTTPFTLRFSAVASGGVHTGNLVIRSNSVVNGDLTIPIRYAVPAIVWGDVDFSWRDAPGAAPVSARDALICLSHVVGRDVAQFDLFGCDVAPDDGPLYTGAITAKDALVILSLAVGKSTGSSRIGLSR